jgi:hypothetical protein
MAMALKNGGFKPVILHEKNDYIGVGKWLGEKYMTEIPHQSIESQNLEVSPDDTIVVPEIFGYIMSQVKNLPPAKIVLAQSYSNMLETLQPGETWSQFGFTKCITTSVKQKEYIDKVMRGVSYDVIPPIISDVFEKSKLPSKTIVAVHTKEQRDTVNLIKAFYLKYPQFRWITFRDLRTLSEEEFAKGIQECCLSVWIDETSSYGTFPLESIKSNVPVLGLVPNMVPDWMNEDNGLWINNKVQIVDFIADYLQNWLEDNVNENLFEGMKKTSESLLTKENFDEQTLLIFDKLMNTRLVSFIEQLNKLETIEE